jgi:hypothetical protein
LWAALLELPKVQVWVHWWDKVMVRKRGQQLVLVRGHQSVLPSDLPRHKHTAMSVLSLGMLCLHQMPPPSLLASVSCE